MLVRRGRGPTHAHVAGRLLLLSRILVSDPARAGLKARRIRPTSQNRVFYEQVTDVKGSGLCYFFIRVLALLLLVLAVPTHSAWLGNGEIYRDEKTSPNILVPLTKADLCSQRDAVLDKALSLVE